MSLKNKILLGVLTVAGLAVASPLVSQPTQAASPVVLDLSEWQGTITLAQAKKLKAELGDGGGVILRVQYGSNYRDKVFDKNAQILQKAGVKFGVYTFSQYINAADAKQEAKDFYTRAKKYNPVFYVNDAEENTITSGTYAAATKAWADQMKKLTNKPLVLYSYRGFYNTYIKSKAGYSRFWLAAYQSQMPTPKDYGLWQYTDSRYSASLAKSTDANKFIGASWFGNTIDKSKYTHGGIKVGETVRLKAGVKWYNTGKTIDKSLAGVDVRVSQTQTAYTGKSNELITVVRNGVVLGVLRAEDVADAYYQSKSHQYYVGRKETGLYSDSKLTKHKGTIKVGQMFHGTAQKVGNRWVIKVYNGYINANKRIIDQL